MLQRCCSSTLERLLKMEWNISSSAVLFITVVSDWTTLNCSTFPSTSVSSCHCSSCEGKYRGFNGIKQWLWHQSGWPEIDHYFDFIVGAEANMYLYFLPPVSDGGHGGDGTKGGITSVLCSNVVPPFRLVWIEKKQMWKNLSKTDQQNHDNKWKHKLFMSVSVTTAALVMWPEMLNS